MKCLGDLKIDRSSEHKMGRKQKIQPLHQSDVMMPLRIVFSQRNNLVHLFQHAFR